MTFGDFWTPEQAELAGHLFKVWAKYQRWPVYQWVANEISKLGMDPVELLTSFPVIGGPVGRGPIYGDIAWDRLPRPREESTVRLTVAGLGRMPAGKQEVDLFLLMLRTAAEVRRQAALEPLSVTRVNLTSDHILKRLSGVPADWVNSLSAVFDDEPLVGFGSRGQTPEGSWRVELDSAVTRYALVDSLDAYLELVRKDLSPPPAVAAPRVLGSPLNLATAMNYLDVTWQLHRREPLFVVTDMAAITSLAFDVGGEDEFRGRCSTIAELLKTMRVPGVKGVDKPVLARFAPYLGQHLADEDVGDAERALAVLDAIRRVRVSQQHTYTAADGIAALNSLGVPGPPFQWPTAWIILRERATESFMDLRAVVARLPPAE